MKALSIQSSRATLDISSTRAQLQIQNRPRRNFTVKSTPPRMMVESQRPQMKVDWRSVWNERGMRSPDSFRQYMRDTARQMVQEAIQRMVAQGDSMSQIQNYLGSSRNMVGELALEDILQVSPQIAMSSGASSPSIEWTEAKMSIQWSQGEFEIVWDDSFMPDITVTPYSVEIKIKDHAQVHISVNEDAVPQKQGKKVDKSI